MEAVLLIILVLGAILVAGVLFCAWAIVSIVRGIVGLVAPKKKLQTHPTGAVQVCGNAQCGCANPSQARFCRRCGKSLPSLLQAVSSRVAML